MFYSHQLLSRKGPMGQIWIAATIRAHINRRKAASIDIEQICKQILYPPVPLALRLSGILMGGVVHVYHRKVCFLYEDLNAFLIKIKTETARKSADTTSLPSRKASAKFEKVTIDYGFDIFDDIEQLRKRPESPQDGNEILGEEFFILPNAGKFNLNEQSSPRDHFQAAIDDITLQETNRYSPHSIDEFPKGGGSTSPEMPDDIFPEFQLPDNLPPNLSGGLHTIFEEQLPGQENVPENTLSPDEGTHPKHTTTARRSRKRASRKEILDDDATEVPANVFYNWLQDTSDIVGHALLSKITRSSKLRVQIVQASWSLPSACVLLNASSGPEPAWAPPLQDLWRRVMSAPTVPPHEASRAYSRAREPSIPPNPSEETHPMDQDNYKLGMRMTLQQSPPGGMEPPSLGSVEKLRAALQTPNTGSQNDIFGKQHYETPGLLAQLERSGKSFKRPKSTLRTGGLALDIEGELPASGKLKPSPGSSSDFRKSMSSISGELPDLNFSTRRTPGMADLEDYFATGDFHTGILTQSQLLEDTAGSTQAPVPADSINGTTIVLAKHLKEHFKKLEAAECSKESLDKLTAGLDKSRAAKMFYQVCVLASNNSVTVEQVEPYGDILLSRGPTL